MKSRAFGVAVVLMLVSAAARKSPAQSTHDADVRELERLETVWNEAHEHGDADALEAIWADDLEIAVPRMPVGCVEVCSFRPDEVRELPNVGSPHPGV